MNNLPQKTPHRLLRSSVPISDLSETFCPICKSQQRKFLREEREFPIWECRQCRHLYVSPRPSRAWLSDYYANYWRRKVNTATASENKWQEIENRHYDIYEATVRAVTRYLPAQGALLDVGMEYGGFLELAVSEGWQISGIEIGNAAFAIAQKRLGQDVCLYHDYFENVDIAPASVDCIVMLNVIEHIHDPVEVCRRAFDLLRPGGGLALRWPNTRKFLAAPAHLHQFSWRSITRLFHSAGFIDHCQFWAGTSDYSQSSPATRLKVWIARFGARSLVTATFGKCLPPFVSKLTLGRKPLKSL